MTEPMTVRVEVWPLAADDTGIWLISGDDAWRPALPVGADSEPHSEVELALASHGIAEGVALLHSTSWRDDGPSVVLTYVAVIRPRDLVLDQWPHARPVSPEASEALLNAARQVAHLLDTDATCAAALDEHWRWHLRALALR